MALGNYDFIAWNENGEHSSGEYLSPDGVKVEVYKDWLYLHDSLAWKEGNFTFPVVGEFAHGELTYRDVTILGVREMQRRATLYFMVFSHKGRQSMAGITCYAYAGETYVGVVEEQRKNFSLLVTQKNSIFQCAPDEVKQKLLVQIKKFPLNSAF